VMPVLRKRGLLGGAPATPPVRASA
jgi:hypothetical protein